MMEPGTPLCPLHLSLTESGRFVRREGNCATSRCEDTIHRFMSVSECERGKERAIERQWECCYGCYKLTDWERWEEEDK